MNEESRLNYYRLSIEHRNSHKCGGYPFSRGLFLNRVVEHTSAHSVLEIGTAIGYSAYCFADGNDVSVTTIDMVELHGTLAREQWQKTNVSDSITFLHGKSSVALPVISSKFDIVFFDGFAPNPDEVKEYVRLTSPHGIIISTNLSWNKTTPKYLEMFYGLGLHTVQDNDISFSSFDSTLCENAHQLWITLDGYDDSVR